MFIGGGKCFPSGDLFDRLLLSQKKRKKRMVVYLSSRSVYIDRGHSADDIHIFGALFLEPWFSFTKSTER